MRYFKLLDDVTIADRWHIGEVRNPDGGEPRLRFGIRQDVDTPLTADATSGQSLEFSLSSFAIPIASDSLADAISTIAGTDVQALPVTVAGTHRMKVLNALRVVDCIDDARCDSLKWTSRDHRSDLAGQYRQVTRLVLDSASIPQQAHFFRLKNWMVALVVSAVVKAAMESQGCQGAKFSELELS